MSGTLRTCYRGWNIAVRCLGKQSLPGKPARAGTHAATAHAYLQDSATRNEWIDPRPQSVVSGSRNFDTTACCSAAVLAEIKILIDALRR
ncbi:MAG: hypothetical protein V4693_21200 [Pseudomonadota bacterium]